MWKTFSPMFQPNREKRSELEGSLLNLIYSLVVESDKLKAISQAFSRDDLPNINSLLSTILIFGVVIYFQVRAHLLASFQLVVFVFRIECANAYFFPT